jgi:hypothetical protein
MSQAKDIDLIKHRVWLRLRPFNNAAVALAYTAFSNMLYLGSLVA